MYRPASSRDFEQKYWKGAVIYVTVRNYKQTVQFTAKKRNFTFKEIGQNGSFSIKCLLEQHKYLPPHWIWDAIFHNPKRNSSIMFHYIGPIWLVF